MKEGKKISAMLPRSWKKSFDSGIIIPKKMRFCNKCNDKEMCNKCNNQINEIKEFEANLNELKRHSLNDFGYMLPYYKKNFQLFVLNHLLYTLIFFFLYYIH